MGRRWGNSARGRIRGALHKSDTYYDVTNISIMTSLIDTLSMINTPTLVISFTKLHVARITSNVRAWLTAQGYSLHSETHDY